MTGVWTDSMPRLSLYTRSACGHERVPVTTNTICHAHHQNMIWKVCICNMCLFAWLQIAVTCASGAV